MKRRRMTLMLQYRRMLKKAVRKAAASEEARRTLRYVEPLSDARTRLADFFSILLDRSFPGRVKRMVVDQFFVCGKVIGFNGEVSFVKRFGAGGRTEIGTIRFSLLFRGESA